MFRYSDYYRQIFTRLRKKMFRHRDCYGQTVTRLRNNYCFAADVVIVRLLLVLATITTKVSPQRLLSSDFYSSWEKLFRYRDWNRHFFFTRLLFCYRHCYLSSRNSYLWPCAFVNTNLLSVGIEICLLVLQSPQLWINVTISK